jgi:DNA repair protein RadD
VLDELWAWFAKHQAAGNPIVKAAVGAGKSLMIAAVAKRMHEEAPGSRVLVLVHQAELLDQNLARFVTICPEIRAGVISASRGRKELWQQVTFATIGSVWKIAHKLGRIDMVMADECHLINPKEEGMWRSFLRDLETTNPHARCVGWTGTDFRGSGVFLTAGETALFTHVAATIGMTELLEQGFLAPLQPIATTERISTDGARTTGDDYRVSDLAKSADTAELVQSTAAEICSLFAARKRWLVFAVTIEHAEHMRDAIASHGIAVEMVSAKTPTAERARIIERFRRGELRCLVNVAVLTTGFDVPELDAIALLRATKSPVLYVQIAGRGMRLAPGKTDCLWADFTDTTARMGPVDAIKGRPPSAKGGGGAPFRLCPKCGSQNAATARSCLDCGFEFPEPVLIKHGDASRGDAVLSAQLKAREVDIDHVTYAEHSKEGSLSMRVDYWRGPSVVAKEWVAFDSSGYARLRAERWWSTRAKERLPIPGSTGQAIRRARSGELNEPVSITLMTAGKYPEIVSYKWFKEAA